MKARLVMSFLKNSKGFSLIEALLASGILCVGVASMAMFVDVFNKSNKQLNERDVVEAKKQEIISLILDRSNWAYTVTNTTNTSFDCIRQKTDCSGLVGANSTFKVYNSKAALLLDTTPSTFGFNTSRKDCNTFNASNPKPDCPYRYALTWEPICPSSGTCLKPRIKVFGTFYADLNTMNSLSTTKSLSFILTPPIETLEPPLAFNDTYYFLKNSAAADLNVIDNDKSTLGQNLQVSLMGAQSKVALANITTNGTTINYTPVANFTGLDSFQYQITQPDGSYDIATVWIKVMTPYTWTGEGPDSNWSTAANWCGSVKADHSGCDGATNQPNTTDTAILDNTSKRSSANITSAINVAGIQLNTGYGGTLTQLPGQTISMGGVGFSQSSGIFMGGDSNITSFGPINIVAGSFKSTSANLTARSHFIISNTSTFDTNSALITLAGWGSTNNISTGNLELNNLSITGASGVTYNVTGALKVSGLLDVNTSAGYNYLNGIIEAKGDIQMNGASGLIGSNGYVRVVGNSNQTITGNTTSRLPNFEIASTGGTVTLSGAPHFTEDFTYTSGTVNAGGSTVIFDNYAGGNAITPGPISFQNVTLTGATGMTNINGTMSVFGTLAMNNTGSSSNVNNGVILAYGDITASDYGAKGNVTLRAVGTNNRTISGTINAGFPNFEIATTGGVSTLSGVINIAKNLTYISGSVDAGTSLVHISSWGGGNIITPGTIIFNEVRFNGLAGNTTLVGTMTVNSTLTLTSSSASFLVGGTILAKASVNIDGYGFLGSTVLKINGSSNQTITGTVGTVIPNIPRFEIASTGGTVQFVGTLLMSDDFTYTSGTVDAGTSTVTFSNWATTATITPGPINFNHVRINGGASNYTLVGTMTINGDLNFDCTGNTFINSGVLNLHGNLTAANNGVLGTATLNFVGNTNSTISITGTPNLLRNTITVNKTGAQVQLLTSVSLYSTQSLVVNNGTLNLSGHNLSVGLNVNNSASIILGTSPSCGNLTYSGSYVGAAAICL